MSTLNLGTDETEVMYWCNTCSRFVLPNKQHDGTGRDCKGQIDTIFKPIVKEVYGVRSDDGE